MKCSKRTRSLAAVVLTVSVMLFFALPLVAGDKAKDASKPHVIDITKLVWPPPPQTARFKYVKEVYGEADLEGKKKKAGSNWLEKVIGTSLSAGEKPRMLKPYGVAVDSKGNIFVVDSGAKVVFVFNLETQHMEFRGDAAPARFMVPLGAAIDDKDRLFVSDAVMKTITCFGTSGEVLGIFGDDKLDRPVGMAVDNDLRRLYVADTKKSRIAIFDLDSFQFRQYWSGRPADATTPIDTLGTPMNLAVDPDGLLYVVDTILNQVEVFDAEGNLVRFFGEQGDRPGKFLRPKGIAIDGDGHVYVVDSQFNNFQVFTPIGQPLMAVGSFGAQPGQFGLMTGIAIDRFNRVILTDQSPGRIQVMRYVTDEETEALAKGSTQKSGKLP